MIAERLIRKKILICNNNENIKEIEVTNDLNVEKINELIDIHIDYVHKMKLFNKNNNTKFRLPNFPEGISENIVKEYINKKEKRNCKKSQIGGDLVIYENNKCDKIEVKCFTSDGPTSFGPTEKWKEIYFIDAKDFLNKNFKIYKINLSNDSIIFSNIKINKDKTYIDVCKEGKRPRINFNKLKKQLKDNIQLLYQGDLNF